MEINQAWVASPPNGIMIKHFSASRMLPFVELVLAGLQRISPMLITASDLRFDAHLSSDVFDELGDMCDASRLMRLTGLCIRTYGAFDYRNTLGMNIQDELAAFLTEALRKRGKSASLIQPETSFMDAGVLDSLSLLDFVRYLEKRFAFQISGDEIVPENFATLSAVTRYVQRRLGHQEPQ